MAAKEVVGRLADLAPGTARRYEVAGHSVAVVRIDDDVYAIGDTCSHQDVSLAEGEVDEFEKTLECWKHGSAFDLASGEALTLPATRPVPTYEARIEGDEIVVVIE
jgi:3-phenylpropionate/trans-cinnamate dioxygenase ferredoxin component